MAHNIIIIAGATASGKSGIALSLAQKTNGVIINADSQQMYDGLRVLTARPSREEEAFAPHKLYGVLNPDEPCSVGKWLRLAQMEIDWALSMGSQPIVVGGTGMYISALMNGIADIPEIPASVRAQSMSDYEQMGKEAFASRLREIDPAFFDRLKVQDKQRLTRAYEVWLGTGKTLTWWQQREVTPPYPANKLKLYQMDIGRERLYERCNLRFDQMLKEGALQEVKTLMQNPPPDDAPIMKTLGLRELWAYLKREMMLEEATQAGKQATRNYAKRQLTWLRNQLADAVPITTAAEIPEFQLTEPR